MQINSMEETFHDISFEASVSMTLKMKSTSCVIRCEVATYLKIEKTNEFCFEIKERYSQMSSTNHMKSFEIPLGMNTQCLLIVP